MVKKLLKLKLLFISAWFFVGSISSAAPLNLSFNATFSLLHAKVYSNVKKNATTANFYFAENLTFVNYLWEDTPTATAGFKMVFQKVEALLLKEEAEKVALAPQVICKNITIQLDPTGNANIIPADIEDGTYVSNSRYAKSV